MNILRSPIWECEEVKCLPPPPVLEWWPPMMTTYHHNRKGGGDVQLIPLNVSWWWTRCLGGNCCRCPASPGRSDPIWKSRRAVECQDIRWGAVVRVPLDESWRQYNPASGQIEWDLWRPTACSRRVFALYWCDAVVRVEFQSNYEGNNNNIADI